MPRETKIERTAKSERIIVRATPEETAMLAALSEQSGLSMSDVVRQLIRKAHAETIGSGPKSKRSRKH